MLLRAIKTLPQVEELHRTEVKGRNQEWRGNPVRKIEVSGECLLGDGGRVRVRARNVFGSVRHCSIA